MTLELIPASAVADLPAVVAAYLLGLCDADRIASRDGATPASADDSAVAIRTLKNCSDVLSAHLGRAEFGCAIGELFMENAWLASFRCELTLDWSLGDEGQVYEETSVVILDLQLVDGAGPTDEVRGTDGSLDREAAEAVLEAFFDEHRYELAQLLRDGSEDGSWSLQFDRAPIAEEIGRAEPSGRRIWDALLTEWPGSNIASSPACDALQLAPQDRHTVPQCLHEASYLSPFRHIEGSEWPSTPLISPTVAVLAPRRAQLGLMKGTCHVVGSEVVGKSWYQCALCSNPARVWRWGRR